MVIGKSPEGQLEGKVLAVDDSVRDRRGAEKFVVHGAMPPSMIVRIRMWASRLPTIRKAYIREPNIKKQAARLGVISMSRTTAR
jgi:hypothetical protein